MGRNQFNHNHLIYEVGRNPYRKVSRRTSFQFWIHSQLAFWSVWAETMNLWISPWSTKRSPVKSQISQSQWSWGVTRSLWFPEKMSRVLMNLRISDRRSISSICSGASSRHVWTLSLPELMGTSRFISVRKGSKKRCRRSSTYRKVFRHVMWLAETVCHQPGGSSGVASPTGSVDSSQAPTMPRGGMLPLTESEAAGEQWLGPEYRSSAFGAVLRPSRRYSSWLRCKWSKKRGKSHCSHCFCGRLIWIRRSLSSTPRQHRGGSPSNLHPDMALFTLSLGNHWGSRRCLDQTLHFVMAWAPFRQDERPPGQQILRLELGLHFASPSITGTQCVLALRKMDVRNFGDGVNRTILIASFKVSWEAWKWLSCAAGAWRSKPRLVSSYKSSHDNASKILPVKCCPQGGYFVTWNTGVRSWVPFPGAHDLTRHRQHSVSPSR